MRAYFCKLLAPRVSFADDMSESEMNLMNEHAAYWRHRMAAGSVVVFGFVADPEGPHGVAIVEVGSEEDAQILTSGDPVILANCGFKYNIFPMPFGAAHPLRDSP